MEHFSSGLIEDNAHCWLLSEWKEQRKREGQEEKTQKNDGLQMNG